RSVSIFALRFSSSFSASLLSMMFLASVSITVANYLPFLPLPLSFLPFPNIATPLCGPDGHVPGEVGPLTFPVHQITNLPVFSLPQSHPLVPSEQGLRLHQTRI